MAVHEPIDDIRTLVIENGCFSRDANTRIFEKWFRKGPRGRIKTLIRRYGLSEKVVADIGCGYGNNLIYFGKGSYGFEIWEKAAKFAQSLGLAVHARDLVLDDLSDLPRADVAFCYAVIEHVESPHIALRKLHGLLKPDGLALIYVPTIPALGFLRRLPFVGKHFGGHLNVDHVNAFTPATIRFMVERAGFKDVRTTTALSGICRIFDIPPFHTLIDGAVVVARKDDAWDYHPNSTRRRSNSGKGFVYKE